MSMKQNTYSKVKALAFAFDREQLENCMEKQIQEGRNTCVGQSDMESAMNLLAKANFVKALMQEGMSDRDALRELGKRMRKFNVTT